MNVFLNLEDIFVHLYFHTQFYIQLVQQFVQIDVGTTPSDFTTLLRILKPLAIMFHWLLNVVR